MVKYLKNKEIAAIILHRKLSKVNLRKKYHHLHLK